MNKFDRQIKKLSKDFQVPDTYYEKVDGILETIQQDCVAVPKKKPFVKAVIIIASICLLLTGYLRFSDAEVAQANFFDSFKQTVMDFLGIAQGEAEKLGVESKKEEVVSKPDLMIELQEVVMDTQSIYAVIKITAPPSIEFKEGMTFDYFGFCEGTNYNGSSVVPGIRGCTLLEVLGDKTNVATFVIDVSTDRQIKEGKDVTVFFQDLIAHSYEDKPKVLVEGMWSLSFTASYTNSKNVTVQGNDDMKYSFADTTADIEKIKLLPLGMTLVSDVSNVDANTLNTTDTRIAIRLKMIDGSEIVVTNPDSDDAGIVNGGSISVYEKKGRVYQKYVGQFKEAIDVNQVLGIYIADYYVPLKEYE